MISREKDANLYLQAKSGLKKQLVNSGSSQLVIASVERRGLSSRTILHSKRNLSRKSQELGTVNHTTDFEEKILDLLNESEFQKKLII